MQIVGQQEFAMLCNIDTRQISVYIKRGKIIPEKIIGEGKGRTVLIDTEHAVNKLFIKTREILNINKGRVNLQPKINTVNTDKQSVSSENQLNNSVDIQDVEEPSSDVIELNTQLKQSELRIRNQKEENNRIYLERLKGNLIYTDVGGRLMGECIQRYKSSMIQDVDELIRDICNTNQIDNILLTEYLSKLRQLSNRNSERADEESKIAVRNSITDSLTLIKKV
jgi:hypothetical protein